jgi:DNA invertase Pin-like site-specific DNA recombinase
LNTVVYARYSSDNQREESIEGQLRECGEYAEKHGLVIIGNYIDRAFSAKTDARPEFQRMLRDSAKKQFEIVLVWKLDRFSRSREDSAINKHKLKKNGVKVLSATENISDDASGILMEAVLEGMAEYYSAELSEKITRGLTENALKMKHNGGNIAFGYLVDSERHYQPDPITAPIVREIFERYADGDSLVDISKSLNARGIRTAHGKEFNRNSSLHLLLKNRKYCGEYKYRDIVFPNGIPAIVPQELFDKVQIKLAKNKLAPSANKAAVDYILTTKLFCGECGAFMTGESGKSRTGEVHYYYKCGNAKRNNGCHKKAIRKDAIEKFIVAKTREIVLTDEIIAELADRLTEVQKRESTALPILQKQLAETQKSIDNLLNALEQGIITSSTKKRLEDLEGRKAELEIGIAQEKIARPLFTREQIIFWVSRFKHGDINDPDYRQRVAEIFVNAIYVYDDRTLLLYNYKDGTRTVTFGEVNAELRRWSAGAVSSSDFAEGAPPLRIQRSRTLADVKLVGGGFGYAVWFDLWRLQSLSECVTIIADHG